MENNNLARQKPHDLNAEASVLSAMMIEKSAVVMAAEELSVGDFYRPGHQIMFEAMVNLEENNIEVDIITLINKLKADGTLEKVGGEAWINEISDVVMSGSNVKFHINIIKEKSVLRTMINESTAVIEACYSGSVPTEDIVSSMEIAVASISAKTGKHGLVKISESLPDVMKEIEMHATVKASNLGIGTGYISIDHRYDVFRPGSITYIAGRPSMGKTTLALNFAIHAAMRQNKAVAIFTNEMDTPALLIKMLGRMAEVDTRILETGFGLDEKRMSRVVGAAEKLWDYNIYTDDVSGRTVLGVRRGVNKLLAMGVDVGLIIVDYLQLMRDHRKGSKADAIANISNDLTALAKDTKIATSPLVQLNRELEGREDKRPKLSDLKGSGDLEQDADMVIFIYRDEVYNENSDDAGFAEILISKNRMGATGKVKLLFEPALSSFRDPYVYE